MEDNNGFAYAYGCNIYYQKLTGLWPREGEVPIYQKVGWLWAFLIFIGIWLPQAVGLAIIWGDLNSNINFLSMNVPIGCTIIKVILLQSQRNVTGTILSTISANWTKAHRKNDREIMLRTARISRSISTISFTLAAVTFVCYFAAQVRSATHLKNYSNVDSGLTLGLPFDCYLPFDTTNMFVFASIWIAQSFSTLGLAACYAGPDALVAMIALHLCGELRVLRSYLKNLATATTVKPPNYWQRLGAIVNRHEEINELACVVKEAFSFVLLIQLVACTVTFGLQGYVLFAIIVDDKNDGGTRMAEVVFSVSYCFYTSIHLFFYCYVGDTLLVESAKVSDDFYDTSWYNLAPEEARAFLLVCQRSNAPLQLNAANLCTFDLRLFATIMKNSMGYVSMLKAMR